MSEELNVLNGHLFSLQDVVGKNLHAGNNVDGVKYLNLHGNRIKHATLVELNSFFPSLVELNLSSNEVTTFLELNY